MEGIRLPVIILFSISVFRQRSVTEIRHKAYWVWNRSASGITGQSVISRNNRPREAILSIIMIAFWGTIAMGMLFNAGKIPEI